MHKTRRVGTVIVTLILLAAITVPVFAAGPIFIPMISKGFQHQFWQTVMKGAKDAADKYNVVMTFEGPPTEADIQQQVQMLVNAMAKSPSAICLAALDTNSVMDQLNEAMRRKIPIIGFDSGVPNAPKGAIYATAATNSYAAAGLAAQKMFPVIKDKIKAATPSNPITIIDFNQDATSQSVTDRGKGFRDMMIKLITTEGGRSLSDIKVTGNRAYIAPDSPTSGKAIILDMVVPASPKDTDATATAQSILNRVKSDHIVGIFCSNEGTARALLSASNDGAALPTQYPGLVVIGFDAGKAQKAAVRNRYFFGAITQDPYMIGYYAMELAYKAVMGQPVADIDTGAKFFDYSNMDQPDIAQLLYD
ncbi:MAG TPA: ABC transporter substrate-binding protein [Rectinema sp.]|jgi:ribose transport system substrate-binding protein|nr:ABC transporter substrate-binding protein [Spirochaetia bacterium]MDI9427305.1 ABC transporter substrate-binding protein [Spirochaetota bacterium]NLH88824.1 substrate-binding domain-containing protein [Treponema sp.]HNP93654.1 ABC transporter substrate-binding protein [Rectinema sp.]HNT59975.1 ABC transporter substrate-binding protein [Rectinema sp.]